MRPLRFQGRHQNVCGSTHAEPYQRKEIFNCRRMFYVRIFFLLWFNERHKKIVKLNYSTILRVFCLLIYLYQWISQQWARKFYKSPGQNTREMK